MPSSADFLDAALVSDTPGTGPSIVDALRKLVDEANWQHRLARLKAFPDLSRSQLSPKTVESRTSALSAAVATLETEGRLSTSDTHWLRSYTHELTTAAELFQTLRDRLAQVEFFSDPVPTQTYRLGVLIENQARVAQELAAEHGSTEDGYEPTVVHRNLIETPTGATMSIAGAYEGLVEVAELILRYSHFRAQGKHRAGRLVSRSPFDDPVVPSLLRMGGLWKIAQSRLGRVRFAGWVTHTPHDHACYVPIDRPEARRRRIGELRNNQLQSEFFGQEAQKVDNTNLPDTYRALSHSLGLPKRGAVWCGRFDGIALDRASSNSIFERIADRWILERHFQTYADSVVVHPGSLDWPTFRSAFNRLRAFAHAVQEANTSADPHASVLVAAEADLARICQHPGVSYETAQRVVAALTFTTGRRSLELWTQPLLPLSPGLLLIVPGLIGAASPIRTLENAIAEWGERKPGMRGTPFENTILRRVQDLGLGRAVGGVCLTDRAGKQVEYDLVWWWGGYLFLVEAKCLKSCHSDAEFLSAKSHIEEALTQLERRRTETRASWPQLRALFQGNRSRTKSRSCPGGQERRMRLAA